MVITPPEAMAGDGPAGAWKYTSIRSGDASMPSSIDRMVSAPYESRNK
jgi:hypothetical protein